VLEPEETSRCVSDAEYRPSSKAKTHRDALAMRPVRMGMGMGMGMEMHAAGGPFVSSSFIWDSVWGERGEERGGDED